MAPITATPHDGLTAMIADEEREIRFTRLAQETTGYTRRVMLRLADEAHMRALAVAMSEHVIDLHLVPNPPGSSRGVFRTYE
jgi:hypothetical protein